MIRTIMYATDFSTASHAAFPTALELAQATRAHLVLAHVLTPVAVLVGEGLYMSSAMWEKLAAEAKSAAQDQLEELADSARKAGIGVTTVLVEGVPAEQIVRLAADRQADLLVLGTHGRTGFSKMFLGSVATRVVATAGCPVVTVRGA